MASLIPDPISDGSLDLNLDSLSPESVPLKTAIQSLLFFSFSFAVLGVACPRPVLL